MKYKKYFLLPLLVSVLLFSSFWLARADDDDDDDDRDRDRRRSQQRDVSDDTPNPIENTNPTPAPAPVSAPAPTPDPVSSQKTVIPSLKPPKIKPIPAPVTVITKTIMEDVILPDLDRDGLPDSQDPHPDIAEIYIIRDDNGNGIDDNYEPVNP